MPADIEAQRVKASRIEEACELLRRGKRPDRVRKMLRDKYDLAPNTIWKYVQAALQIVGPERVRSLNAMRCASSNDLRSALKEQRDLARKALEEGQYVAAAMAWRAWQATKQLDARLWHLDKISPLMGIDERDKRVLIVEAIRDGAHLLTAEQRQELLDALAEVEDGDESVTTTLEAR